MMKLKKIINATRRNEIEHLLEHNFANIEFDQIMIYAEHSVSFDTAYKFFKSKRGMGEIIIYNDIYYERLCSLQELNNLINFFLSNYSKKDDDILVIEVLDYLDNDNSQYS